jgi:N-acetyl sugar amidotransferase
MTVPATAAGVESAAPPRGPGLPTESGYRVCNRCVMDTSDVDIRFDGDGVCNHCHGYDRRAATELLPRDRAAAALDALAAEITTAGRGQRYDCLIGVSGGVDSTSVARLVKSLGLRPLAVHLDNGWNVELAVSNIERCLNTLEIDLHTHVVDWEEFRDLQMAFLKASIANIEIVTDHAIMALLFRTAARLNIRYIISGGNLATESVMPRNWMYDARDLRLIRSVHRRFGTRPTPTYPACSLAQYGYFILGRGIKYVPILNYVDYNKEQAKQTIVRELGWKDYGGKHGESFFTRFFQDYILPRKFGMDKRRPHLSSLVLSGQITRGQALATLDVPPGSAAAFEADLRFFLKKMRLTAPEFDAIMQSPVKTFRDYPSNAWLFARHHARLFANVKRVVKPASLARAARAAQR